jgi:hypothetical protein
MFAAFVMWIKFEEFHISHRRTCWKRYDSINAPRWNLEIKPFIVQWIVQMKENMCKLGVIGDHMLPWGVAKKMCYCWLVLKLQEGKDVHQP